MKLYQVATPTSLGDSGSRATITPSLSLSASASARQPPSSMKPNWSGLRSGFSDDDVVMNHLPSRMLRSLRYSIPLLPSFPFLSFHLFSTPPSRNPSTTKKPNAGDCLRRSCSGGNAKAHSGQAPLILIVNREWLGVRALAGGRAGIIDE